MDDPHILSRRQVRLRPKAAREDVVSIPRVDPGKPVLDRRPGLLGDFKLHRPACLLLDYSGAVSNPSAGANIERRPKDVIHHSDQGSQYTSVAFGKRCGKAGVRPSMGSVGDAYDNAMAESFFSTLEAELLSRRRFASQAEAKMACFSYIKGWYNPVRLHSGLGYRSPITYEADMQAAMTKT
jgi:transposase InsO family protein